MPLATVAPLAVETLLDAAFGTGRHARTAYRLRAGVDWLPALSFGLVADGVLLGSVQCWPIRITSAGDGGEAVQTPLTLLGPVAVDPAHQAAGLGKRLTRAAIHAAIETRAPSPVLIGDPGYYQRFGFVGGPAEGWDLPGPFERHRLLVLPLSGAALPTSGMLGPAFAPRAQMA